MASSGLFLQLLGAVVGGVALAAILALWHKGRNLAVRAHVVLTKADHVTAVIAAFGEQWTAAQALAATIASSDAALDELQAQLGTAHRDPDWELEKYLRSWRHEQRNATAELKLVVEALQKIANQMTAVAEQMVAVAAMIRPAHPVQQ